MTKSLENLIVKEFRKKWHNPRNKFGTLYDWEQQGISIEQFLLQSCQKVEEENTEKMMKELGNFNVSKWKAIGKERGYWDYFKKEVEEEVRKEITEKIRLRMIEEANTPLGKRKSGWDLLIEVRDNIINPPPFDGVKRKII